jgi:predicted O-linked N-acetylglucosamine transferase (SPINDLY family)
LSNLATLLHEQGRSEEALKLFLHALQIQPGHADALYNVGNLYQDLGATTEAIDWYQKAIAAQPHRAGAHNNLGNAFLAERRHDEAMACYQRALALDPECAESHLNQGIAHSEQEQLDKAALSFSEAVQRRPEKRLWQLRSAVLCPAVFSNTAELDRYRRGLLDTLDAHQDAAENLDWRDLDKDGVVPSFNLCHHGRNNRPLLERFAALYQGRFPQREPPRSGGRPRIGFLVTRHHEKGFLRSLSGIIEQLDPTRFEPVVLCSHAALKTCQCGIRRADVDWVAFPNRLATAAEQVAAARCEILYHWQIGTDPLNYFLPLARLAPIQCTSWGSHGTTGMTAVDYCLSSSLVESPEADQHYTEHLVRLSTLPTYQRRHASLSAAERSVLRLPERGHLYCCPQRIAKLHPEADELFAAILSRDAEGFLVLLEGKPARAAELLRERLRRTLGSLSNRVVYMPVQSPESFRRLLTLSDVMIDPPHYSAGLTAYDAFAAGVPVVSLPDEYAVGRYTLGCYRKMGLDHLIPRSREQYVSMAVRLGTDRSHRQKLRQEIANHSGVLFEDVEVVREYERFFEMALHAGPQPNQFEDAIENSRITGC